MVLLLEAIAVGLVAGFTSGLLGIGGGVIVVPALVLFGVETKVAIATSLLAMIIITMSGGATHWRLGHVHARTAFMMAVPAMLGAQAGALLLIGTPSAVLEVIYGLFLLVMASRFLRGAGGRTGGRRTDPRVILPFGFAVGVLGAYFGIGGGVVMVLFMTVCMGYDMREAIGTSTVVIVLNSLAGTAQYVYQGVPDVRAGIAVGIAGAITAVIGARTTLVVDRVTLRRSFGVFLAVIALRFLGVFGAVGALL